MHTVVDELCTGCERCLPVGPVDCIALVPASRDRTGWRAWSPAQASQARRRYERHQQRVDAPPRASAAAPSTAASRQQAVAAALARARAARAGS